MQRGRHASHLKQIREAKFDAKTTVWLEHKPALLNNAGIVSQRRKERTLRDDAG